MRVLWLTTDRSRRVAQLFDPLRREVGKIVSVTTVFGGVWSLSDLARGRQDPPRVDPDEAAQHDLIFTDAPFAFLGEAWERIRVPKAFLVEDQHGPYVPAYAQDAIRAGFGHAFMRYRHGYERRLPFLRHFNPRWLPHSIDPAVFRHGLAPKEETGILLTGSTGRATYPLRAAVRDCLRRNPGLGTVVERPPEGSPNPYPRGGDYARILASARAAVATGSVYRYVVAKYLEIPACGTCLLAEALPDLADLGFRPGVNFWPLDPTRRLDRQLEAVLADPELTTAIGAAGARLVALRHTAAARARELVTHFQEIVR